MDSKYEQYEERDELDDETKEGVDSAGKVLKSSRTVIKKITQKKSTNPVRDTLDIVVSICKVVVVFEPTIGLTTGALLLFKDLMDTWHGQFQENASADQHFLTLMGIAMNEGNLSTARSGLEQLMEKINAQIEELIAKQQITEKTKESFSPQEENNANWFFNKTAQMKSKLTDNQLFQSVLNVAQLKKDKENWLRACQLIYEAYKVISVSIRANLQKCVDTIRSSATTLKLEPAKKLCNQIYHFVHLIYFRHIVFMVMANIFGDGSTAEDKPYLFESKDSIIHELNASNVKLLSNLEFLWRPKLENRIIATLFYHNKVSMMAINCLQHFDERIIFSNPEQDLCPFWNHHNVISPFFRLCCKKWPEDKFCIGVDKKFTLEAKGKNNNLALRRLDHSFDVNAFGRYRIHLFYTNSTGAKLLNLYYHSGYPLATDYMTLTSTKDDEWVFIVVKIFDDEGEFYYISPYADPKRYIYMKSGMYGEIVSYDGVNNKPTEQAMWLAQPGTQSLDNFFLKHIY